MPKLLDTSDMQTGTIPGLRGYGFSAVRADRLGASEYTLVTLACDVSGSVVPFRDLLVDTVKKAVNACRKSPRAANIMVRVITFNQGVREIHGFKPLADIDDAEYDAIGAGGGTALFDASASAIGATTAYGKVLADQDYAVNGIMFVITDGEDFDSTYTAATVKEKADEAVTGEVLDSFIGVLVGVNAARCKAYLERFRADANITQYVDAGDATPGNLAKIAQFVSRSVSSQAGSVGTGQSATVTF
jgi:uncharacterized protein YegL